MPRLADSPYAIAPVLVSDRPQRENRTGNWRTLRPVIELQRCTGCMICWKFCPEACVAIRDALPAIDYAYCKGCGICAAECPRQCVALPPDGEEDACAKS